MRAARRMMTQKGQYAGWRARKPLTVDHTKAAGSISPFIHNIDLSSDSDIASLANSDLSDVRFTDSTLKPLPYEIECQGGTEIHSDTSWCWFNGPRVVCYKGLHNRVYSAVTAGSTGSVFVAQFDVDTNATVVGVLHSGFEVDDHSCPGLVVLPSGKIMAFYARHNTTDGLMFYRTTTNAEDVSAWSTEQSIQASLNGQNACYANPRLLSSENAGSGRMYVFFRDNHSQLSYITSDNYTATTPTWAATQPLITNGTTKFIYNKQADNGTDRVDICFTDDAPDLAGTSGATVGTNNLYHVYIKAGNVCTANGTVVSSLASLGTGLTPSTLQSAGAMIASTSSGPAYWTWDIAYDGSGNPCFVYVRFPNSDWSGIEYWYARWTGSAWTTAKIVTAGSSMSSPNANAVGGTVAPSYAGGISILPDDVNTVYLSRQVSKTGTPDAFELEKWHTTDNGLTWSKTKTISPGVRRKNTRPVCPRNRALLTTTPPEVYFMSGAYTSYQHLSQSLMIYPPPSGMTVKRAARVQIPTVDNSTDKTLLMYYGNPNATDASSSIMESSTYWAHPFVARSAPASAYYHASNMNPSGWGANFTLSGWANMPTSETDGISDFFYSSANLGTRIQGIRLWMTNGVPAGDVSTTGGVVGGAFSDKTGLNDGALHHYALTYDGTTLTLYVDGVAATTTFTATSPPKNLAGGAGAVAATLAWSPAILLASTQRRSKATLTVWQLDNVVRSTAWIQTRAKAQSGLVTVGANVNRQW